MVDEQVVRRKARDWTRDVQSDRGLSDAEAECLRDLLKSDEAFAQLVTAQQAAVSIDAVRDDVDDEVEQLAREGASPLGEAIDLVIDQRIDDAKAIVSFSESAAEPLTWGVAMTLYQRGFTCVADLRGVDKHELIAEAGIAPALADKLYSSLEEASA